MVSDIAIPLVGRGQSQSMEKRLRGTKNEVWLKYLKRFHKHKAMPESEWLKIIEATGKLPSVHGRK